MHRNTRASLRRGIEATLIAGVSHALLPRAGERLPGRLLGDIAVRTHTLRPGGRRRWPQSTRLAAAAFAFGRRTA
jgi:hypothetical protein